MKVEILYVPDCPHFEPAVKLVESILRENRLNVRPITIAIHSDADALRYCFPGSPTIRIDGEDVVPVDEADENYGVACRRYGSEGVPPRSVVELAVAGTAKINTVSGASTVAANRGPLFALSSMGLAVVGSACCWLPPMALLLGGSVGTFGIVFRSFRPWALGIGIGLFTLGVIFEVRHTRRAKAAACDTCAAPPVSRRRLWLSGSAAMVLLASMALPSAFGVVGDTARVAQPPASSIEATVYAFAVDGLTCAACSEVLGSQLRKMPEALNADVDHSTGQAWVSFAESRADTENEVDVILTTLGFRRIPSVDTSTDPAN